MLICLGLGIFRNSPNDSAVQLNLRRADLATGGPYPAALKTRANRQDTDAGKTCMCFRIRTRTPERWSKCWHPSWHHQSPGNGKGPLGTNSWCGYWYPTQFSSSKNHEGLGLKQTWCSAKHIFRPTACLLSRVAASSCFQLLLHLLPVSCPAKETSPCWVYTNMWMQGTVLLASGKCLFSGSRINEKGISMEGSAECSLCGRKSRSFDVSGPGLVLWLYHDQLGGTRTICESLLALGSLSEDQAVWGPCSGAAGLPQMAVCPTAGSPAGRKSPAEISYGKTSIVVSTQEKQEVIFRQQKLCVLNLKFLPFIPNSFCKKRNAFCISLTLRRRLRENTTLCFSLLKRYFFQGPTRVPSCGCSFSWPLQPPFTILLSRLLHFVCV